MAITDWNAAIERADQMVEEQQNFMRALTCELLDCKEVWCQKIKDLWSQHRNRSAVTTRAPPLQTGRGPQVTVYDQQTGHPIGLVQSVNGMYQAKTY
jgi:hypothetical protein